MLAMGLSIASSVLGGIQQNKNLSAQYKQIEAQHEMNIAVTRSMLNSLGMRVNRVSTEITRDKLAEQKNIHTQATEARGSLRVQAAQLGVTGKRSPLNIQQKVGRAEADAISDSEVNAETQQWNLKQTHLDQAQSAITNLNNQIPNVPQSNKWMTGLQITGNAAQTYYSMDKLDKAQFNSDLTKYYNKAKDFFTT